MKKARVPIVIILVVILFVCSNISTNANEEEIVMQAKKADMMNGLVDVIKNYNSSSILKKNENDNEIKDEQNSNITSIFDTETKNKKIKIFFHKDDITKDMYIEAYVLGVLAAEMSDSRSIEALKAQAVAIRTLAYYRIENEKIHEGDGILCTDSSCCQAWEEQEYSDKYKEAVKQTEGIVIKYDGEYISSHYFACSGGYTENAENVWGSSKPYLVGVPSPGEAEYNEYFKIYQFTEKEFANLLEIKGASFRNISDVRRSESGRIITLNINGEEMTGRELRAKLELRSTNAYFSVDEDGAILISVFGYGHGVGMSQCGADAMAIAGADYIEILTHYYTGVTIGQA